MGNITKILVQISRWVQQWKNFENLPTSGKVVDKNTVSFLTHSVYIATDMFIYRVWLPMTDIALKLMGELISDYFVTVTIILNNTQNSHYILLSFSSYILIVQYL